MDNSTCTGIVDSDIASTAAISGSKLATITTAGKVDGASMTNLANIPSGAGAIPVINLSAIYPVGSIYMNASDSTNPGTLFGFGTWVAITDRIIIGVGSTFTPAGSTSGSSTVTIAQANLPSYNLSVGANSSLSSAGSNNGVVQNQSNNSTVTISSGGSGTALNVMNPYYAAYIWRRTV